jgi:hypothetical protein
MQPAAPDDILEAVFDLGPAVEIAATWTDQALTAAEHIRARVLLSRHDAALLTRTALRTHCDRCEHNDARGYAWT